MRTRVASGSPYVPKVGMSRAVREGQIVMAVLGMANQSNRSADGYRLPIDDEFNA